MKEFLDPITSLVRPNMSSVWQLRALNLLWAVHDYLALVWPGIWCCPYSVSCIGRVYVYYWFCLLCLCQFIFYSSPMCTNYRLWLMCWDSNFISFCSDFSLSCDMWEWWDTLLLYYYSSHVTACALMCQNGGTRNETTCTCDCADGYCGDTCGSVCIAGHFIFHCTIGTCVLNVYYLVLFFCKVQTMQN